MKAIALLLSLFFCHCAYGQSVTVTYKLKAENLKTSDSLVGVKPCNGIAEVLNTADAIGAVGRTPIPLMLAEANLGSDTLSVVPQLMLTVTFSFPPRCILSVIGQAVICATLGGPLVVTISAAPPGAVVSSATVTVTAP